MIINILKSLIYDYDDSSGDFIGMVDEELSVVHAFESLHVYAREDDLQVLDLRLGDKRFFGAVPEMDVVAENLEVHIIYQARLLPNTKISFGLRLVIYSGVTYSVIVVFSIYFNQLH